MHPLKTASLVLSVLAMTVSALGMLVSFFLLADKDAAGTAGFIAGAILIGAGLVSLALLSLRNPDDLAGK